MAVILILASNAVHWNESTLYLRLVSSVSLLLARPTRGNELTPSLPLV